MIKIRLPDEEDIFKMIVLADWGFLNKKKHIYDPLTSSFDYIIERRIRIDAVNINGDIAYDLDSNEGVDYEQFLRMLSQISCRWPVILNAGNHEHISKTDMYLFNNSFETYRYIKN